MLNEGDPADQQNV